VDVVYFRGIRQDPQRDSFIVYPSACYDSAPARQIYVKLCIGDFYYILSRKSLLGENRQKYLVV